MTPTKRVLLTMLALTAMLSAPLLAQSTPGECSPPLHREIASNADVMTIVETANEIALRLPTRSRVAAMENADDRLAVTKILDHVALAQRADRMTPQELEAFGEDLQSSVAAAQIGISACEADVVAFEQRVQAAAAECSCVQTCYNEWRANLKTCNGGYWCQVGFNLLFELCLLDCLVPG